MLIFTYEIKSKLYYSDILYSIISLIATYKLNVFLKLYIHCLRFELDCYF